MVVHLRGREITQPHGSVELIINRVKFLGIGDHHPVVRPLEIFCKQFIGEERVEIAPGMEKDRRCADFEVPRQAEFFSIVESPPVAERIEKVIIEKEKQDIKIFFDRFFHFDRRPRFDGHRRVCMLEVVIDAF